MRISILIATVFAFMAFASCSGKDNSPTLPLSDEGVLGQNPTSSEVQVLTSGTMNLEDGTIEFNDRAAAPYYNVTGIVGSNFSYYINGFIPPNTFDIILTIHNVSGLTVYDVCIVFENLYGKTVLNPDSYMDIFQSGDIDPYIAFRKESPNRAFPPVPDTEQLLLKYAGGSLLVDFFIIAHLGGNTGGVYELSDWNVDGKLVPGGGTATISVSALDHQNDVSYVRADTTAITGGITFLSKQTPPVWSKTISNSQNAPIGTYIIPVRAASPSSPQYSTYNFFELEVEEGSPYTEFGTDFSIEGDTVFEYPDIISTGHHSMAARGNTFYLAFYNTDGGPLASEGAIYFSKSTDGGTTWSTAKPLTDEDNGYPEAYPCMALGTDNIYIVYSLSWNWIKSGRAYMMMSANDGNTWTYHEPSSGIADECGYPSVCVDKTVSPEMIYVAMVQFYSGGDRIKVARAPASTPDIWQYSTPSNGYSEGCDRYSPAIVYDPEFDHLLICWSDENLDGSGLGGNRLAFDMIVDSDEWPHWFTSDIPITDHWVDGDLEYEASLYVNPRSGILGVLYRHIPYSGDREVRFIRIDHEDPLDLRISPSVLLFSNDYIIFGTSLHCEDYHHWLATWFAKSSTETYYNCYFMESLDANGATWENMQILNDDPESDTFNPNITSNGNAVCVAWSDGRSGTYEIYIDRGYHD